MARCTAPIYGHRTASGRENCPACGGSYRGYNNYSAYSLPYSSYSSSSNSSTSSSGGGQSRRKAGWSSASSTILYTPAEIRTLTPVRENIEKRSKLPDLRDVFLCHAWDDRKGIAKQFHDLLEASGIKVWFSEKDVGLGVPLLRAIDKGLANSRVGLVLVTPSMLQRLPAEGIADKELSVLLSRDRIIPIVHDTTYDDLRDVSPLLGSRSGLDTAEESIEEIVTKLKELITL